LKEIKAEQSNMFNKTTQQTSFL